ncbi:MAG: hypothetical protein QM760_16680 [Nibricoccus sp.]
MALHKWAESIFSESSLRHYRLVRRVELSGPQLSLSHVYPLCYGDKHEELASFIASLRDKTLGQTVIREGAAVQGFEAGERQDLPTVVPGPYRASGIPKLRFFVDYSPQRLGPFAGTVREVVQRRGHAVITTQHNSSVEAKLFRMRTADYGVLLSGHAPAIPVGHECNILELEAEEAKTYDIPMYVFFRGEYDGTESEPLPEFLEFRGYEAFKDTQELSGQIVGLLDTLEANISARFDDEHHPVLVERHQEVVDALEHKAYAVAEGLNQKILSAWKYSMRAHYNAACIEAGLSQAEEGRHESHLRRARHSLSDALTFGIIGLVQIGERLTAGAATERILADSDLAPIFRRWPELPDAIRQGSSIRLPIVDGGGCACGCDHGVKRTHPDSSEVIHGILRRVPSLP